MERTLDSIRPSDLGGDLTYMYARDPSILTYAQRPIPIDKKNLISLYEEEESTNVEDMTSSSIPSPDNLQTVKVYLRLKPLPRKVKVTKEEAEAYQIINSTTLLTKLPMLDHTISSFQGAKMTDTVIRKFTFSHTFGPETTQFQLFEDVVKQKMIDFLAGHNATLMTYGTTNSGKSYTLQGTTTSPGIIPRGLEFVFSNINTRPTPSYKPTHNSDVVSLSPVDRAQELEAKNKLLTFASVDKHAYINAYKQMQKLLQEESPIRPSQACDAQYSVWVSFAEIYNENIYDLLSNDCQKRRPLLKLGTDSRGQAFIKGLKTVCVNSGSEAYQVLMAGQYNLKVAATALNARSSRSHCIFTIKLLKYYVENKPSGVEVSTFAFCDLAGSERLKKTLNVGERLKEAQNINTSLLVLGRCLKAIYEGQTLKQRNDHVGPFRDSKLTRLFQRALSGKEQIVLIVNVNPLPNLYVETQNVLNFSAIAKKIVIEPKKVKRRVSSSRFSQIVAQSVKSETNWNDTELTNIVEHSDTNEETEQNEFVHQDEYDELLDENKSLKKEIGALKVSMFNRDLEIRQELADMYTAMMRKLETDWKNRIKDVEEQQEDYYEWSIKRVETFYQEKISELTSRKRRRTDCQEDDDDEEQKNISDLEIENARLTTKLQSVKQKLKNIRGDCEVANGEKNKLAFELSLANEELKSLKGLLSAAQQDLCSGDDEVANYIETLKTELGAKQDRITSLKKFLDEAKEEYIRITSDAADMERRLKQRDQYLVDCQERIADLEQLVEQGDACLAESTQEREILEERINEQANLLREAEEREEVLQAKLIESENTVQRLKAKILNSSITGHTDKSDSTTSAEDQIIAPSKIKQEVFSESDGDLSMDVQKSSIPDGIIIKTDDDEVLGIPVTSYENDRESEMFVEVREISSSLNNVENESESPTTLRGMVRTTEAENAMLKTKLSRSLAEIRSLTEKLDQMKTQFNEITFKRHELKAAQNVDAEGRAMGIVPGKSTHDRASLPTKDGEVENAAIERINCGSQTRAISENDQTSQTSFVEPSSDDKSVQTNIIEENKPRFSDGELENLQFKYDELKAECEEKVSLIEKLEERLETLQAGNVSSIKDIAKITAEKATVENTLRETENRLKSMESEIINCRDNYEAKISTMEKEIAAAKIGTRAELEKTHASEITELQKAHASDITEREESFHQRSKELAAQVDEMTMSYERCASEKAELEKKLCDNTKEIEALQERILQANTKDKEKDDEIRQLQKALKNQLTSDVQDKKMQKELKETLKELTETQEALRRTDDLYQRVKISSTSEIRLLETQISTLESKIKLLETRQATMQHEAAELERLRRENEELTISIAQKDQEMDSFQKNRDETNAKWENLMKSKQEELERSKTEIKRFQELFHRMPTTPRDKGAKPEDDSLQQVITVVDLSNSETKRATRRTALPPPTSCPSSEPKRSTRKKRLYAPVDDSCIDLECSEEVPPTPPVQTSSTSTRSLRNRRKP